MKQRSLGLIVVLVTMVCIFSITGSLYALCGDWNGDATINVLDVVFLHNWLRNGPAPPTGFNEADADDHALLTIRDAVWVRQHAFHLLAAPICPPSQPRYIPVNDPSINVTTSPMVFPANVTSTVVSIKLTNSAQLNLAAMSLPMIIRVGNDFPTNVTFSKDALWPTSTYRSYNPVGGPSGGLILWADADSLTSFPPTVDRPFGNLTITMASADPNPRNISMTWANLPPFQGGVPVQYPMIVLTNYDGKMPALNGEFLPVFTQFYATPLVTYIGEPVFFTNTSTQPVTTFDWDFGDGGPHSSLQNPVHTYATTGMKTVTLTTNFAAGDAEAITKLNYILVKDIEAGFSADNRLGVAPLSVDFTDQSLGPVTGWLWDFGEGPTSNLQNPTHVYSTPGQYTVSLTATSASSSDTRSWVQCVEVGSTSSPDLEVRVTGAPIPRPGFIKVLHIHVRNLGSANSDGVLTLDLSQYPAGSSFQSSIPAPDVNSDPMFQWNLPVISADPTQGAFDDFEVVASVQIGIGTPVGTDLEALVSIAPVTNEIVVANNTFLDHEVVLTAIDPNDKMVQPLCGRADYVSGTERLQYTIYFENKPEATAAATYVLIVDTLSTSLDLGSFTLGPSSHPSVLDFDLDPVTREAKWLFDGINLPPNTSPPNGEGFVSFTIAPVTGLTEGANISNRAHIRFDFEEWIAAPNTGSAVVKISNLDVDANDVLDVCEIYCGDADGNDIITISDAVYLINYIFSAGPAPYPLLAGDSDCNGIVTISDAVYLINYIFSGGPAPCAGCP